MAHEPVLVAATPASAEAVARLIPLARARSVGADPAHDFQHVSRVAANAARIAVAEQLDLEVTVAAAWLHELLNYPKDHPDSARSGLVCAEQALALLMDQGWPVGRAEHVAACIRTHAFSSGMRPESPEAAALQDADRLDAIGAIGVARCFATASAMGSAFYHPDDPAAVTHALDDKRWAVDHFYRKLLGLPATMNTATGRTLAATRADFMRAYLEQLFEEIGASGRRTEE